MIRPSPLPGFGLGMGILLMALSLVVLLPLGTLIGRGVMMGPVELWQHLGSKRVASALVLSFRSALVASAFNLIFGLLLAWVLTRYRFPGRRLVDVSYPALKADPGFRCAQKQIACAEVELVHAGNEFNQQQWRHAKPYVQIAEDQMAEAGTLVEQCLPPPVAAAPAEAVSAVLVWEGR